MVNKIRLSVLLFSFPVSVWAANEPWYTYWGVGGGQVTYGGDAEEAIDYLKDNGNFKSDATPAADLFGFYWPAFSSTTVTGVVVNSITDAYKSKDFFATGSSVRMNITLSQVSWSTLHFFGAEPGDGFFLRGDLGINHSSLEFKNGDDNLSSESDNGLGLIVGGGYGLPVSDGTRILFTLLLGSYQDDSAEAKFGSFLIGGMW